MKWKTLLVLVLMMILVIFTAQNYEVVKLRFMVWSFQTSRAIVIFSTLFIGIVIGWITAFLKNRRD